MRITLQGLIDAEKEKEMTQYRTGVVPEILNEINDLIDLANDISISKNEEQIFTLALSLSLLKEKVAKEFIGDVE